MRLQSTLSGVLDHADLTGVTGDDHHAQPASISFSNTSQSIPPNSDFNLDIPLGKSGVSFARVYAEGPATLGGGDWQECASVHVTDNAINAIGYSHRDTGSAGTCYSVTYAKILGVTNLTHKIFDTSPGNRYIAMKDAQIIGSILRLIMHNYFGGSVTLWIKGHILIW